MQTFHVSIAAAEALRQAAPKYGLVASERRVRAAPGIEVMELTTEDADAFRRVMLEEGIGPSKAIKKILEN
jgi:hypothetical protein